MFDWDPQKAKANQLKHGVSFEEAATKFSLQAAQKELRGEARNKSTSGGVLRWYVGARRSSATKYMSLFQQAVKEMRP